MTVTITRVRAVDLPSEIWAFGPPAPDVPDVSLPGALAVTARVASGSALGGGKVYTTLTVTVLPLRGRTTRRGPISRLVNYAAANLTRDALYHLKL